MQIRISLHPHLHSLALDPLEHRFDISLQRFSHTLNEIRVLLSPVEQERLDPHVNVPIGFPVHLPVDIDVEGWLRGKIEFSQPAVKGGVEAGFLKKRIGQVVGVEVDFVVRLGFVPDEEAGEAGFGFFEVGVLEGELRDSV